MLNKIVKTLLISIFSLVFSYSAAAWDDVGHKTTAYIAWQQMTPEARERASKLLQSAPEDSDLSVFFMQDARPLELRRLDHFMTAATWADVVRDRNLNVRYRKYHKSNWHYYDTFWTVENNQIKFIENPNTEGGKALEKLIEFEKVLRDSSVNDAEKAIALAWVMHLVGDLHQPLHNSARVTETEPKGDQGGNLFLLTPQGTPREQQDNLHWFWDSIIVRNIPRGEACDTEYISGVGKRIMKKYPAAKMQNRIETEFRQWHKEGVELAQTKVFSPALKRFETPSAAYKKEAMKTSEERIALAGYRMGALLNRILGQ
jgi:S1/P1 Nuclease.